MFIIVSFLSAIIILIITFYVYLTWNFHYWRERNVPGPKPKPLFGTFPSTITGKRNFFYDVDEIYRNFKGKTKFVGVFMTRKPYLFVLDPELCKEILINKFKHFQINLSTQWVNAKKDKMAGLNPFNTSFHIWKVKRAEIVPGLSYNRIKAMHPIMSASAKKLVTHLNDEYVNGCQTFDGKDISLRFTVEIVAGIGWGIESGSFQSTTSNKKKSIFIEMSKRMVYQTLLGFRFFFVSGIFPFIKYIYEERFFPEVTDRYFMKLTEKAIKMRNSMETQNKSQDFLQYLLDLKHKKQLTNDEIVAHQLTVHYDGFETAAISICHCLLLLARYPYTQRKLRREIQEYIDPTTGELKYDDMMTMPYLDQCIAETLRLYAPLPFLSKICTEACEFQNNDGVLVSLKPGDVCFISMQSFQSDEEYFPQPDTFMPERFDEANGGTKKYKDMGVFLPFGDGPRICIGINFVLAEIKTAIVEIIKHFELTVNERTRNDNYRETHGFMTGLEGGVHLDMKPLK